MRSDSRDEVYGFSPFLLRQDNHASPLLSPLTMVVSSQQAARILDAQQVARLGVRVLSLPLATRETCISPVVFYYLGW